MTSKILTGFRKGTDAFILANKKPELVVSTGLEVSN
jgi:hypothetical protein